LGKALQSKICVGNSEIKTGRGKEVSRLAAKGSGLQVSLGGFVGRTSRVFPEAGSRAAPHIYIWKEGQDCFVKGVCEDAVLPTSGYRFRGSNPPEIVNNDDSKKQHLTFSADLPEQEEMMDTPAALLSWDRQERCFLFITDSKSLQETVCG
jgi:hypothetical protein